MTSMNQMERCCVSGVIPGQNFLGHSHGDRYSRCNHDDAGDNNLLASLAGCERKAEYAAEIFDADQFRGENVRDANRIDAVHRHEAPPSGLIPVVGAWTELRASATARNPINESDQSFSPACPQEFDHSVGFRAGRGTL